MTQQALRQVGRGEADPVGDICEEARQAQPEAKTPNLRAVDANPENGPEHKPVNGQEADEERLDFFITHEGVECAGVHLIIDLIGADHLDDLKKVDEALRTSVEEANATLLHIHLHHFTPNGGISGVAVLAESHISIHTWPERNYAALDVFMCGDADPEACIPVLKKAFSPSDVRVDKVLRGRDL